MRARPHPLVLDAVRRLAVARLLDGYEPGEVAEFLGVGASSVRRWRARHERAGEAGLAAVRAPGRPPRLKPGQRDQVLAWVARDARGFGFPTPCWTAPRLARAIEERFGVRFNHRYLNAWLAARRVTPQVPERVPRERDPGRIDAWVGGEWAAIKKRPAGSARPSASRTRAGS